MIKGLAKIVTATTIVAASTFGGFSFGKYLADHEYDSVKQGTQIPQNRNLDYITSEGIFGIMALILSTGITRAILYPDSVRKDSSEGHEKDPALDDPGAFGPGGMRY